MIWRLTMECGIWCAKADGITLWLGTDLDAAIDTLEKMRGADA